MRLAWRLARRELRGGLRGFWIFLVCLALGVSAIAGVGMVRSAIEAGLRDQGAVLLGGDAELTLTYRFATVEERGWMAEQSLRLSEVVDFRSMAVTVGAAAAGAATVGAATVGQGAGEDRSLVQVKAVVAFYPLVGVPVLEAGTLGQALARDGLPGGVMEKVRADRLGLVVGDRFKLGLQEFRLSAVLLRESDSATGGFALGPRVIVRTVDLAQSGLIAPGTIYETHYRMVLRPGTDLATLQAAAEVRFKDAGMQWRDSRRASPGVERFVERIGSFLILVGLAGLAVGGVGVASAVRAYLDGKVATIATLKVLGAEGGLIFRIYLLQIAALAGLGVAAGLVLGAGVPLLAAPLIEASLPFPVDFALYPAPLIEATFYGVVTALLFSIWPLAQAQRQRAAALYRGAAARVWPAWPHLAAMAGLALLLVGGAVWFSGTVALSLGTTGGVMAALVVLGLAALGLQWLARRAARGRWLRGRVGWRMALAAIGGPRAETMPVILALGLGLSVLATVGQIDSNLRAAIARDLPARAPSFFFMDIQDDQVAGYLARLHGDPAVSKVQTAPMLRGLISQINGRPARDVVGDHWVVMGDRGLTFSDTLPEGTSLTEGAWWPKGYDGPAQVSFAEEEAREMKLPLGTKLTINVLGRDIQATITSLRKVDFSSAGMGFVMAINPAAVQGAPHTSISTVYAAPEAEAAILRDLSRAYPNITAIAVKEAIGRASEALSAIATATAWAAGATLLTGFVVLIGAAAAGERGRVYEAALLKVLGASRGRILFSFALRAALMGAAAGLVALFAGVVSAWVVMTWVMDGKYQFEPVSAVVIILGGVAASLIAGLLFAWGPLAARPAQVLRSQE